MVGIATRRTTGLAGTRRSHGVLLAAVALVAAGAVASPAANAVTGNPSPRPTAAARKAPAVAPVSASTRQLSKETKVDPTKRAMWVWTWDSNADVVSFARGQRVRDVYVYVFPGTASSVKVRDLAQRVRAAGMQPWAMGGDPSWVVDTQVPRDWTREVLAAGVFVGIHLELEPHSLPDFTGNREKYLTSMSAVVANMAATSQLPVDVSLPWWYHTLAVGGTTATDALMKVADAVTIITYSNTASEIEYQATYAAAAATRAQKPFSFASETNVVPDAPAWRSIAGQTNTRLRTVQDAVIAHWSSNPRFRGFAVHDYRGWVALTTATAAR